MVGTAILQRELGSVARKWTNYLVRAVFVLLLAIIVTLMWVESVRRWGRMSYSGLSQAGHELFIGLFVTEVVLVSLAGPLVTGGLIAQERERRTLDLLFLTPLGDLEIVLGKFVSRMAYLLGLILLATPVLLGVLIFGGVASEDILLGSLLVFVCGLWSGAIGLFVSGLARKSYLAVMATYFILLAQTFGIPLVWGIVTDFRGTPGPLFFTTSPQFFAIARIASPELVSAWQFELWPWVTGVIAALSAALVVASSWFLRASPAAAVPVAAETKVRRRLRPGRDWLSRLLAGCGWAIVVAITAAMLFCAPFVLERSHGMALVPLAGLVYVLVRLVRGGGGRRHAGDPPRRVWENPVAWKEIVLARSPGVRRMVEVTLLAAVGIMFLCYGAERSAWGDDEFHGIYLGFELCGTLVVTVILSAVAIAQEAEAGHLDLLLGTPLRPGQILFGKQLGVCVTVAPLLAFMTLHAVSALGARDRIEPADVLLALVIVAVILYFQSSLALLLGLWFRRVGAAIGVCLVGALLAYLFVPILGEILFRRSESWLYWLVGYLNPLGAIVLAIRGGHRHYGSDVLPSGTGFAVSIVFYLVGGAALQLLTVFGFDRFVRRNR